jgi:hypothetical protein
MKYLTLPVVIILTFAGIAAYVSYKMAMVMGATSEQLMIVPFINAGLFVIIAILVAYMEEEVNKVQQFEIIEKQTEMFDRYGI